MIHDEELEEFRVWRIKKLSVSPLDEAFESLERIMQNPFCRGYDSAFRVMARCLLLIREELKK
jgi:hypothetical protein